MSNTITKYLKMATGGMVTGGFIGLLEACWLLSENGAPDLLSPVYAVILYGFIGFSLALGGAIATTIGFAVLPILRDKLEDKMFGLGASAAILPMGGFILFYQVRKVVYAEQMPPVTALGFIGLILLVASLVSIFLTPKLLQNSLAK